MIASIFQFLLNILNFIVLLIVRLILSFFPSLGLEQLSTALDTFFGLMTGALNFTYFMLGDTAFILIDIVILLFTAKHLVLPVINFVRRSLPVG